MTFRALIILVLVAVAATSCGRRGGLESPKPAAEDATPQALPADGVSPLDPGSDLVGVQPEAEPAQPPRRRFFLDFLL